MTATCMLRGKEATIKAGEAMARELGEGDVIVLEGPLGSGKTQFVKGLARGLGVDVETVTSPTFAIVHEYRGGRLPLYHVDLYRVGNGAEALAAGLEEFMGFDGVTVIEWGEKFPEILPPGTRRLRFAHHAADVRSMTELSVDENSCR